MQTRKARGGIEVPADRLKPPMQNPVQYMLDCLQNAKRVEGPLSPEISRIGQEIVDAALRSATEGKRVSLGL
jgi:glucose-fructose oxidoreductase